MKQPLILKISERMVTNRKQGRNEDGLIRIGAKARENLGLSSEKKVELWPISKKVTDRIGRNKVLSIFEAYSMDLKDLRESGISEDEFFRVGFVTKRTFDYLCREKKDSNDIWIADTIEDTVIGADPEFLLQCEEGVFKYASYVSGFSYSDKLGSDGPWAELRPTPAIEGSDLVKNIMDLLKKHPNAKLIEKYNWLSGCYYYGKDKDGGERTWPIGGHIHIGTPIQIAIQIEKDSEYRLKIFNCLKKMLDEYLAIPMMKVGGIKNEVKRRTEFGNSTDIRLDHNRLEYRTLSGEWVSHPELAKIVLDTTKAVSLSFFKTLEDSDYDKKLITSNQFDANVNEQFYTYVAWDKVPIAKKLKFDRPFSELHNIIDKGKMSFNKEYFKELKKKFKSLVTYKDYNESIDKLIEFLNLSTQKLKSMDRDLKHNWVEDKKFIIS